METTNNKKLGKDFNNIQDDIISNIDNPKQLEKLYRENQTVFKHSFNEIYDDIKNAASAQVWNERLNYQNESILLGQKHDIIFIIIATFITGLIAKIPQLTGIDENYFFPRNISFIVLPMLMTYFIWKGKLKTDKFILPIFSVLLSVLYINFLPNNNKSDTIMLACIHLPIFLWTILGYTFAGGDVRSSVKKIQFLQFNGDFVVMTTVIMLAGILFTGITMGLFELIGLNIEKFYQQHILIWAVPAVPILSTYLVRNNPGLVNKISPTIAKIFTPIVFVTLFIFLGAIIYTGKNVYIDRNFLLIFNALLIGVMAIILFSLSEATKNAKSKINLLFLFGLSVLTIVLNGIALSAISFRLAEFGITPNRIAVLGANLLIFTNLVLVAYKLFFIVRGKMEVDKVETTIAFFIPIYGIWTATVTFILPLLFNFK
jgi:hypothetical protein